MPIWKYGRFNGPAVTLDVGESIAVGHRVKISIQAVDGEQVWLQIEGHGEVRIPLAEDAAFPQVSEPPPKPVH